MEGLNGFKVGKIQVGLGSTPFTDVMLGDEVGNDEKSRD